VQIDRTSDSLTVRFKIHDRPGMRAVDEVVHPVIVSLAHGFEGRIADANAR
jgi:hypothetical protein